MPELGNTENKKVLLCQVQQKERNEVVSGIMTQDAFVGLLKQLLDYYSDLKPEDYLGWVSEGIYQRLTEGLRDPEEMDLWNNLSSMPEDSDVEIQNKLSLVLDYIARFPEGPKIAEAEALKERLSRKQDEAQEALEWSLLDKYDYSAMSFYLQKYPNSAHKVELDEAMWQRTDGMSLEQLQRYVDDWQDKGGQHVKEAQRIVVLSDLKAHPEKCGRSDLEKYIREGLFTKEELVKEGILPPERVVNMEQLPNLEQYSANPNYEAKEGSTDIYLFGVPGTGKTCLLMGLTGAAGHGYTINFREHGGPYASALLQYLQAGVTPESTPGKYVTTINSLIEEKRQGKKTVHLNHHVNYVEMSGEEFAHKIANGDGDSIKFTDMGDGTTHLLRNSNRKVFFIIIDPTVDNIKFTFNQYEKDENGNVIGIRPVTEYINQLACINKFVALFEAEENKEFMKKVDAIHFIVTKADTFGDDEEVRKNKAREWMMNYYLNPVEELIGYCRRTNRVNYATDFCPMVYPFSLGRFYVGGTFDYNNKSTLKIINVIRHNTPAKKEDSFWDKVRDFLA